MRVAVIGSRNLTVDNLSKFLPVNTTEIVSGGARGIDTCARRFAVENSIPLVEFLPKYEIYGKRAPLVRNTQIVEYADMVVAFWNGKSKGTMFTVNYAKKHGKTVYVYIKSFNDDCDFVLWQN